MSFNASIPGPNDLISQSQAQIQTNFSQSNAAFGIDHTAFDVNTAQGFHKKVTLVADLVSPAIVGAVGALYANTINASHELFYKNSISVKQVTASSFQTYTPVITSGTAVYAVVSALGYYAVIGGMTFWSAQIATTGSTVGSAPIQITLPSTAISTGGAGVVNRSFGSGTISIGNNYIIFPFVTQTAFSGASTFLASGFYI